MHKLAVLTLALTLIPALGCRRAPPEEDEPGPDTAAMGTEATPAADSMKQWIRVGERSVVRTPNGAACLVVPAGAKPATTESPFVRITIRPRSTEEDLLPPDKDLEAFRVPRRKAFAPIYDFLAVDMDNKEFSEFTGDSLIVALCVKYRTGEEGQLERARIARPDPKEPFNLQFYTLKDPPEDCELCPGAGSTEAAAENLGRRAAGAFLTPTPAYAAETEFKGIGGGGTGNSPFAAVDTLPE